MGCLKLPYKSEGEGLKNYAFLAGEHLGNFGNRPKKCINAYEYYLKDHLGNTRVTFTTKPKTINFKLNYESDPNLPDDEGSFDNVQVSSIKDFNRTTGSTDYANAQILRSSPNSQVGSVIAIPVGQGDKITAVAYAKYMDAAADPNVTAVSIASALVSAFTGSAPTGFEGGTSTINNNFGSNSLIGSAGFDYNTAAPKAFLNLMFLPDGDPIALVKDASFSYDQIAEGSTEALINGISEDPFDELKIEDFEAPASGYVMIYLSNEGSLSDIYFDDLAITVNEHPVIETNSYYPFGLTQSGGYQRVTAKENMFKYNGKELIADLDLGWYDYGARYYDPSLSRFHTIDPLADKYDYQSPYAYAVNNPILFIDRDGKGPDFGPGTNPLMAITSAFSNVANETGRLIDNVGGKLKGFFSFGSEKGGSNGPVKANISNETRTTITAGTDAQNFFTPTSDNKPSTSSPFTIDVKTTNENKVTISAKTTVEGVDVHTKNVTSQDNSTGEIKNNTTITVGKDQTGVFVKTGTDGTTMGVRTEQKVSSPTGHFIKFGGELSIGN